jgi:hypothetical protein
MSLNLGLGTSTLGTGAGHGFAYTALGTALGSTIFVIGGILVVVGLIQMSKKAQKV